LNVGWAINYTQRGFWGFSSLTPGKCLGVTSIKKRLHPSTSFSIRHSPIILPFGAVRLDLLTVMTNKKKSHYIYKFLSDLMLDFVKLKCKMVV
jgi:hypothetical protein